MIVSQERLIGRQGFTRKGKTAVLIFCLSWLLISCYPASTSPSLTLRSYKVGLLSGEYIQIEANLCVVSYESEVFDGDKTPLLLVECWIRSNKNTNSYPDKLVFSGLSRSFQDTTRSND